MHLTPTKTLLAFSLCAAAAACGRHEGDDARTSTHSSRVAARSPAVTYRGTCQAPLQAVDTSNPTTVVGNGPGTCTEQRFVDAVRNGGIITFDCGGPATIRLHQQVEMRIDRDTVIDGGGQITLDGGNQTRLLYFYSDDFRAHNTTVTLQGLTLVNGASWGTDIPPAEAPCAQGVDLDGSGAAIFIRDGLLHVIGCTFRNNAAPGLGPDVGGGAIYAAGSLDTTIVGSTFDGNSGSNGGAIGSLLSNLVLVGNTFTANRSTGIGGNQIEPNCPHLDIFWGGGRSGSGGNGGAVYLDGQEDFTVSTGCNTYIGNSANAFGGAFFRTSNAAKQTTSFDQTLFDGNTAAENGGAIFIVNNYFVVTNSTFANNTAANGGAFHSSMSTLDFTNVTLVGNRANNGLGGAIFMDGNGALTNCTIANNTSSVFGAAISTDNALTIRNSIFANNTSPEPYNPMGCTRRLNGDTNLQWPQTRISSPYWADDACVANIAFVDAQLVSIGSDISQMRTLIPQAPDSVVKQGWGCPATDALGNARHEPCTLGALER